LRSTAATLQLGFNLLKGAAMNIHEYQAKELLAK
jgi:hypothetical protein